MSSAVGIKICAITAARNYKVSVNYQEKEEKAWSNITVRKIKAKYYWRSNFKGFNSIHMLENIMKWKKKLKKFLNLLWNYIETMEMYCISCKKYTVNETNQNILILLSKCAVCGKFW